MVLYRSYLGHIIQIETAHTAAWPQGIIKLGTPHTDIEDWLSKARKVLLV